MLGVILDAILSVHRGAYTGYCLAAVSNDGLAQCSAYCTDASAVLDVRIAACLLLVSAAVVFYAIVSVHRGAYTSYCLSRCYLY